MPIDAVARSPYEVVLGGAVDELHPRLRTYFSAIPAGCVGIGHGVFDVVGTPRGWLTPVLWVLARQRVLAPGWHRDVPFVVQNRPGGDTRAPSVLARRTFEFARGAWTMRDAIAADRGRLIDDLGGAGRYRADLAATVRDGRLLLRSTKVAVRIGRRFVWIPRLLAPEVRLEERFDDVTDLQHVSLRLQHPLLGVLYEYRGHFSYAIENDTLSDSSH